MEESLNFDIVLHNSGGFGWYQKRLWFSTTVFLEMFMSQNQMFMIFAGAQPKWTCGDNSSSIAVNGSALSPSNVSQLFQEQNCDAIYRNCGYIQYDEDISTVATEFGLYCSYSSVVEIMMSIQMFGIFIGACFWGQMAELFGRKKMLFLIAVLELTVCIAMSFSPSWQVFVGLIFICGFGTGGYWNVVYVLVQEQVVAKWRLFASAINGWCIGMLVFPLITWYLHDWRKVLLISNGLGMLSLFTFIWFEESPRWLVQHGRLDEAYDALSAIARVNGSPPPDKALIKLLHDTTTTDGRRKRYSYRHLFHDRSITTKVVALAASWFVVSCVSNALAFNVKNLPGNRYINILIMSIVGSISGWLVLVWNKCFGRRKLHQLSLSSMGLSMLVVVMVILLGYSSNATGEMLITAFAITGSGFSAPAWQVVYLYSVEMFPTVLRPLSNGMGSMAARIGGIVAPMILILGKTWVILPYFIFLTLCVGNLLISCTILPETKDRPLPETLPKKKALRSANSGISTDSKDESSVSFLATLANYTSSASST